MKNTECVCKTHYSLFRNKSASLLYLIPKSSILYLLSFFLVCTVVIDKSYKIKKTQNVFLLENYSAEEIFRSFHIYKYKTCQI